MAALGTSRRSRLDGSLARSPRGGDVTWVIRAMVWARVLTSSIYRSGIRGPFRFTTCRSTVRVCGTVEISARSSIQLRLSSRRASYIAAYTHHRLPKGYNTCSSVIRPTDWIHFVRRVGLACPLWRMLCSHRLSALYLQFPVLKNLVCPISSCHRAGTGFTLMPHLPR
jgi:hypothetical protein